MGLSPTAGGKHRGEENLPNGKHVIGQPQGHRRRLGVVLFYPAEASGDAVRTGEHDSSCRP